MGYMCYVCTYLYEIRNDNDDNDAWYNMRKRWHDDQYQNRNIKLLCCARDEEKTRNTVVTHRGIDIDIDGKGVRREGKGRAACRFCNPEPGVRLCHRAVALKGQHCLCVYDMCYYVGFYMC